MVNNMLRRLYHNSALYLIPIARKLTAFYAYAFNNSPNLPVIPWKTLRHTDSVLTYLWDVYEEIDMLDIIQEDATELRALSHKLQGLCD
jgi:hypothetical protein